MAAEIGTRKVISEHSTIGLVVTTDGSISDIPRDEYAEVEERVINELNEIDKPFVVIMNCVNPRSEDAKALCSELSEKYSATVIPVNCLELNEQDIRDIITQVLFAFPIKEINIRMEKWITGLEKGHWLKNEVFSAVREAAENVRIVREVKRAAELMGKCQYVVDSRVADMNLGKGSITIQVSLDSSLFYKILGEATGIEIVNESDLLPVLMELNNIKKQFMKIKPALDEVEATGYGIVMPDIDELSLEEPEIIGTAPDRAAGGKLWGPSGSLRAIHPDAEGDYPHRAQPHCGHRKAERGACYVSAFRIRRKSEENLGIKYFWKIAA